MKKQGIIISVVLLIVLVIVGIVVFYLNSKKEAVETVKPIDSDILLPDILEQDFTYNISTTEETTENVIFSIVSKEKDYPIYYAILEMDENGNIEEIEDEDYCLYEKEIVIERNSYIFLKYKSEEKYSSMPYKIEIKNIISSNENEEEETITEEELKEAQVNKEEQKDNKHPYYVKVNYGANVVTIYQKDENNEYTIPIKSMVCSCGIATPTSGVYKTTNKYVWRKLVGGVYGQYATRIVGSILFHSVPYTTNTKDSLEYWEYDKLGTKASAGCVRLTVADAKWIYSNCAAGTMVEFYSSSNPGPLGKPSSKKISQYTNLRNWDPTDSDPNNPWNYETPVEQPAESNNSSNTDSNNNQGIQEKPGENQGAGSESKGEQNKETEQQPDKEPEQNPDKEDPDKENTDTNDGTEEKPSTKPDENKDQTSSEGSQTETSGEIEQN